MLFVIAVDDGKMKASERAETLQRFRKSNKTRVLLMSLRAGSVGLNLVRANRVYLMDIWWNNAVEQQAMDRVHRIGQAKDVFVRIPRVIDSIEDKILAIQQDKKDQADGALGDGTEAAIQRLSTAELKKLLDI